MQETSDEKKKCKSISIRTGDPCYMNKVSCLIKNVISKQHKIEDREKGLQKP